jgi:HK97 gp10 family phage protein
MSVKFEGLEELIAKFKKAQSPEQMREGLETACLIVERAAKQKAPKGRTGELANSISHRVEGEQGIVFTPLFYAPYVEFGTGLFAENGGRSDVPWSYKDEQGEWHSTSGMKPQPYMRPALDENREDIKKILAEGVFND